MSSFTQVNEARHRLQTVKAFSNTSKRGSGGMLQSAARDRLRARYDQWWSEAVGKIRAGKVESDPVLEARVQDRRRGLTVIARPTPAVRQRAAMFLGQLRQIEPAQYYYTSSEFHLTVLSLFTATAKHEPFFAKTEQYVSAVDSVLRKVAPFRIEFEGVTASPGTVMIQGFFETDALNDLRDALRSQLKLRGLADGVDRRYRLESAHVTVARFRAPLRESERFAAVLEQVRQRSFGATTVRNLSLVKNDWYMSHRVTETLKRYRLARTA
jgi:2'-5' RNA ligase